MAYTSTDLAALQTARLAIISRGAQEVEINGRRVRFLSLADLDATIARAEADVALDSYGADIAFGEVGD